MDQNIVTISASTSGPLLLEGPDAVANPSHHRAIPLPGMNVRIDASTDPYTFQSVYEKVSSLVILGYYNVPEYSPTRLQIAGRVTELLPDNLLANKENDSAHEKVANVPETKKVYFYNYICICDIVETLKTVLL